MPSNIHLNVDEGLRQRLRLEAARRGLSVNSLIKVILWEWLEWKPKKKAS